MAEGGTGESTLRGIDDVASMPIVSGYLQVFELMVPDLCSYYAQTC